MLFIFPGKGSILDIGNVAGQEKWPGSERKKSIVMTQTDPKTPRVDQFQGDREVFQVASGNTMKAIVYIHYGSPHVLQLKLKLAK